ncbi:MAG: ComEC family competence protein [Rickettsiales bacterium]|nr:ComEC family competence protein [Rickettsiales bacterium]
MQDRALFLSIFSFATGIAAWFVWTPVVAAPLVIAILCAAVFLKYKWLWAAMLAGFFWAGFQSDLVDTKLLLRSRRGADVVGIVERADYAAGKTRVFVRTPEDFLFRISIPEQKCAVGRPIALKAKLYAPTAPDAFNRFDYARWSLWTGQSATGSAPDGVCETGPVDLRDRLHFSANNKLVDSLVLGYGAAIPRAEYDAIKSTGAAHIFSISGFHLALVGGWLFFIMLSLVKLFPGWTRRHPARNIALPLTAVGLFGYLLISGGGTATIRSFAMLGATFAALILGRRAFSLRTAAIIFLAMIIANPFWVVSAGFQLSFAAIFGIVLFFQGRRVGFWRGAVMTTIVATLWTAPFVIYHFASFPIYSLLGNLVLLPVFSFAIMPVAMVGALWRWPLFISDYLYGVVIRFANWISALPMANAPLNDMPPFALFLCFAGMLCVLIGEKIRARILFIFAVAFWIAQPTPILKTTNDNEVVSFRGAFNTRWSENHPFAIPKGAAKADCKKGVCEYKTESWTAVSFQRFMPLWKNIDKLCEYDFIISYLPLELPKCQNKVLSGGVRIYEDGTRD